MNAFDSLGALGWREAVLALAALLGLYVVIVFLRLRRLARRAEEAPATVAPVMPAAMAVASYAEVAAPPAPEMPPPAAKLEPEPAAAAAREDEDVAWRRAHEKRDELRRLEVVESEVVSMRGQIEALNDTVAMLVDELRDFAEYAQRAPAEAPSPAAVTNDAGSPLYGDAMQMALAGHDAPTIAERCGIARAEAELVVALAQQAASSVRAAEHDRQEGGGDGGQGRY